MRQSDRERIDGSFETLLGEAGRGLRKVYSQIGERVKNVPPEGIADAVAKNEVKLMNDFILDFTASVKRTAMQEMIESGCKEYLTEGAWSSVLRTVGMPQVKFCKIQPDLGQESGEPPADSKILRKQKNEYKNMKTGSEAVLAAGAVAVGAGLFIPALGTVVRFAVCTAGGVGIVAGGIGIAYSSRKLRELGQPDQPDAARPPRSGSDWIQAITEGQRKLNLGILSEWLKKVKAALFLECDKWLTV